MNGYEILENIDSFYFLPSDTIYTGQILCPDGTKKIYYYRNSNGEYTIYKLMSSVLLHVFEGKYADDTKSFSSESEMDAYLLDGGLDKENNNF